MNYAVVVSAPQNGDISPEKILNVYMNLQTNFLPKHWLFFVKSRVNATPSEPLSEWKVGDRLAFNLLVSLPSFP